MGTNNCKQWYNSIVSNPQNSWKILNLKVDTSVQYTYARYQHMFNPEWFEKHKSEIIGNLYDIHSLLDEFVTNRNELNLTI